MKTGQNNYNGTHRRDRAAALARLPDGAPCSRCGKPMSKAVPRKLHWDHLDNGKMGFSHAYCNMQAGGRKIQAMKQAALVNAGVIRNPGNRPGKTPVKSPRSPAKPPSGQLPLWAVNDDCTEHMGWRTFRHTRGGTPERPVRIAIMHKCMHPGVPHHGGRCPPNMDYDEKQKQVWAGAPGPPAEAAYWRNH